jgi:flagellin-specific chaperone FliS
MLQRHTLDEVLRLADLLHDGPIQELVAALVLIEQGRTDEAAGQLRRSIEKASGLVAQLQLAAGGDLKEGLHRVSNVGGSG